MIEGPPLDEPESGLPGKQGEFTISFPWPVRFALTAAIGAIVGFAASTLLRPQLGVPAADWMMIASGVAAASLLSFRKVHSWHTSTFVDGTIAGIAAAPIFVVLAWAHTALLPESRFAAGEFLFSLLLGFVGMLISVPCGWIAGFGYHLALSSAERLRARRDDDVA